MNQCDKYIINALNIAQELIALADQGDAERTDVGCGVLFGTLRDCAYNIKIQALDLLDLHRGRLKNGKYPASAEDKTL